MVTRINQNNQKQFEQIYLSTVRERPKDNVRFQCNMKTFYHTLARSSRITQPQNQLRTESYYQVMNSPHNEMSDLEETAKFNGRIQNKQSNKKAN